MNALERIVLNTEALTIGQVVGVATISALYDVVRDHALLRGALGTA